MGLLRNRFSASAASPADPGDDDALLVAQARQGDAQAFALLYRRYCDQVFDYAYHRLGSREAAEDATQTIFLKAVAALPKTRDNTIFVGWLFAIARNVITDLYRQHGGDNAPLESAVGVYDAGVSPEELAERAEWSRELAELKRRCLNDYEREVLDLRLQGLNDKEISVALGRSHGAIRNLQYRLVVKLRACMGIAQEAVHAIR